MTTFENPAPENPDQLETEEPADEPFEVEEEKTEEAEEAEEAEVVEEVAPPHGRHLATTTIRDVDVGTFELDQRRAKAYAESGYWPDTKSIAQALVKIEAGRSLGLPALIAMSEVHVIHGKPSLGAGALASLVKSSGRYDYRVVNLTDDTCELMFYDTQTGEVLGPSIFTIQDAERAGLVKQNPTYKTYPRNMLFARALSNGVAWYAADITAGRIYTPEELEQTREPVTV